MILMIAGIFLSVMVFAEETFKTSLGLAGVSFHETVDSPELNKIFSVEFKGLFDEVLEIKISTDIDCNYYYYVEGYLEGQATYELFKVGIEDVLEEKYTYVNVYSNDFQNADEYCKDYSMFPGCPISYCWYGYTCKGAICGYRSHIPPYDCIIY